MLVILHEYFLAGMSTTKMQLKAEWHYQEQKMCGCLLWLYSASWGKGK